MVKQRNDRLEGVGGIERNAPQNASTGIMNIVKLSYALQAAVKVPARSHVQGNDIRARSGVLG